MTTEVTVEQVRNIHPQLGTVALTLTKDYMNLSLRAAELDLIGEKELLELEEKYVDMDNMFERLLNISADILTVFKEIVNVIQVPNDPDEFEKWKNHSTDYHKIVCHDAFVDIFISSNEAISKGLK